MTSLHHDGQRLSREVGQRLLVTYLDANGGKESALVRLGDSYENFLQEACISLDRYLPLNWRNLRREFAHQSRDRQGRITWVPIEPTNLLELGQLNHLPEVRLRVYVSEGDLDTPPGDQHSIETRSPEYEAIQGGRVIHVDDRANLPLRVSHPAEGTSGRYGLGSVLRTTATLHLARDYKNAIKSLRTAADTAQDAFQRGLLLLWIGQISFELKEHHNASSDLTIACDIFKGIGEHNSRLECELMHAKILRTRNSGRDITPLLSGLLQDAQTHGARIAEVQILYELCDIACQADNLADASSRVEHIKLVAQETGDLWCKATEARAVGMINEAGGDPVAALEAYSRAFGMYFGAEPRSPISPTRDLEIAVQRMRYNLSIPSNTSPPDWKIKFRNFTATQIKVAREYLIRRKEAQ
ncbi:hypothetical protein RhiJN_10760 [Ceratobasidium sp. AG-Ba]|nr:hypothetical protein RhiJN_10760 [Ceratobasidium sp. AG-Ba]